MVDVSSCRNCILLSLQIFIAKKKKLTKANALKRIYSTNSIFFHYIVRCFLRRSTVSFISCSSEGIPGFIFLGYIFLQVYLFIEDLLTVSRLSRIISLVVPLTLTLVFVFVFVFALTLTFVCTLTLNIV